MRISVDGIRCGGPLAAGVTPGECNFSIVFQKREAKTPESAVFHGKSQALIFRSQQILLLKYI
jgi:hypothetical protein